MIKADRHSSAERDKERDKGSIPIAAILGDTYAVPLVSGSFVWGSL